MSDQKFYRIKVSQDMDPESPRRWGNVGTMACWHRNYSLGDEQPDCSPTEHRRSLARDKDDTGLIDYLEDLFRDVDSVTMEDVRPEVRNSLANVRGGWYSRGTFFQREWAMYRAAQAVFRVHGSIGEYIDALFDEHFVSLPLYLYDHSGITMSTGAFSCPWDSGQVGFIYVAWDKAVEEYGLTDERFPTHSDKVRRVFEALQAEVEVYDQYLTGDVYGFAVEVGTVVVKTWPNGHREEEIDWADSDSCWGFFGDKPSENGMAEHVGDFLHPLLDEAAYYQNAGDWVYLLPEGGFTRNESEVLELLDSKETA